MENELCKQCRWIPKQRYAIGERVIFFKNKVATITDAKIGYAVFLYKINIDKFNWWFSPSAFRKFRYLAVV